MKEETVALAQLPKSQIYSLYFFFQRKTDFISIDVFDSVDVVDEMK